MYRIYLLLFLLIFLQEHSSCGYKNPEALFEGFKLGERFDNSMAETKFGTNTFKRYFAANRRVTTDTNTYNYIFSNGSKGFVTFHTTGDVLSAIELQVGVLEQLFPDKPSYSDLYGIRERVTKDEIDFLKSSLRAKYKKEDDSIYYDKSVSRERYQNAKEIVWRFEDFSIRFLYNDIELNVAAISYDLNEETIEKIKERNKKKSIEKQSNNL